MAGFDLPAHAAFIREHGERLQWSRAVKCACGAIPDPNRARIKCKACDGLGFRYEPAVELVGLVTGVGGREKALIEAGVVSPGDMVLGLGPFEPNRLADFDRVRLTRAVGSPYEGDVLKRGPGPSDRLAYEATRILSVTDVNPETGAVTTYPAASYTVSGRLLTWVADPKPLVRATYAVSYHALFEWIVFISPLERFEGVSSLGQRMLLRKRHVVWSFA